MWLTASTCSNIYMAIIRKLLMGKPVRVKTGTRSSLGWWFPCLNLNQTSLPCLTSALEQLNQQSDKSTYSTWLSLYLRQDCHLEVFMKLMFQIEILLVIYTIIHRRICSEMLILIMHYFKPHVMVFISLYSYTFLSLLYHFQYLPGVIFPILMFLSFSLSGNTIPVQSFSCTLLFSPSSRGSSHINSTNSYPYKGILSITCFVNIL